MSQIKVAVDAGAALTGLVQTNDPALEDAVNNNVLAIQRFINWLSATHPKRAVLQRALTDVLTAYVERAHPRHPGAQPPDVDTPTTKLNEILRELEKTGGRYRRKTRKGRGKKSRKTRRH